MNGLATIPISAPASSARPIDKGEKTMNCPFLHGERQVTCKVCWMTYIPSTPELSEYCRHSNHVKCPFYYLSAPDGEFAFMAGPDAGRPGMR
jgi:hypothetical protein